MPGRIIVAVGDDRLWHPLADIALAADARPGQIFMPQCGLAPGFISIARRQAAAGVEWSDGNGAASVVSQEPINLGPKMAIAPIAKGQPYGAPASHTEHHIVSPSCPEA